MAPWTKASSSISTASRTLPISASDISRARLILLTPCFSQNRALRQLMVLAWLRGGWPCAAIPPLSSR